MICLRRTLVVRETRNLLRARIERKRHERDGQPYEIDGDLLHAILTAVRQVRPPRREHAPLAFVGVEAKKIEADDIHDRAP